MDSVGATSGLQSGFVLAVVLLAVFFAERLGGSAELARRGFQVALGIALAFLAISATTAFARAPEPPPELLQEDALLGDSFTDEEVGQDVALGFFRDTARNAAEVRTIHVGLGVIFIVAGLAMLARLRVLPLGLVVGGLLLLLFGGASGGGEAADPFSLLFGAFAGAFGSVLGGAGQARDIAHFGVLLAGVVALLAFGFLRWEGRHDEVVTTV